MEQRVRVPVVFGFGKPFRLILREGESWEPTIDQINELTYDYVKLNRISEFIDIGIAPFSLGVCVDGALVLPALEEYRDHDVALRAFNRFLCACTLGGVFSEAIVPDDIAAGDLTEEAYTKIMTVSKGQECSFHRAVRTKHTGPLQSIALLTPDKVDVATLKQAYNLGQHRLSLLGNVTPETFLHGVTFFVNWQWSEALIHLWTTVEQVVQVIWEAHIISDSGVPGISAKRRKDFLDDHRSWPISVKLETLFRQELLSSSVYAALDKARSARNAFAHKGVLPSKDDAQTALTGLLGLASWKIATEKTPDDLIAIEQMILKRSDRRNPWKEEGKTIDNVKHWIALPPIPGDSHWGDKPFEIIEELRLKPLGER